MKHHEPKSIIVVERHRVRGDVVEDCTDNLSVEEPLEIKVESYSGGETGIRSVAVTMRTPGRDDELAAGFLFSECIITKPNQIEKISQDKCNGIIVSLKPGVTVDSEMLERHSFINSSCGVCGKKSIASVLKRLDNAASLAGSNAAPSSSDSSSDFASSASDKLTAPAAVFATMSRSLRLMQSDFNTTGGIHASALFTTGGKLIDLREDVGRHNALDKLIGSMLLRNQLPLNDSILFLSGRASFELIQKAANAGIQIVAAVGAPSSLAVELATEAGITLVGFVRGDRFNIYCGRDRIVCANRDELDQSGCPPRLELLA
jgi:FdhD protein